MKQAYHITKQRATQLPLPIFRPCITCGKDIGTLHKCYCKSCIKIQSHKSYLANREKTLAKTRAYYEEHREQYAEWKRAYNKRPENIAKNREHNRLYSKTPEWKAYSRKWHHEHNTGNPRYQASERARYQKRKASVSAYNRIKRQTPEYKASHNAYFRNRYATQPEYAARVRAAGRLRYATHPEVVKRVQERRSKWFRDNKPKAREYCRNRTARKRGTTVNRVDYTAILKRDGYHCYICNKPIHFFDKINFDHVIPLTPRISETQGTHTEENIRPVHACCNIRKGNKPLSVLTPFDRRGPDN